jgi:hypothetical protein
MGDPFEPYRLVDLPSLVVGGQVVTFLTEHEQNPIPLRCAAGTAGAGVPPGGCLVV